jgi:hypothetical protein
LASRSNTKFQKRQKELARAEKRQDKAARAERRRMGKRVGLGGPPVEAINPADLGLPSPEDVPDEAVKAEA